MPNDETTQETPENPTTAPETETTTTEATPVETTTEVDPVAPATVEDATVTGEELTTPQLALVAETGPEAVEIPANAQVAATAPDTEEESPAPPEPLYPDETVLWYHGPSDFLHLGGRQIAKGHPFYYTKELDEVLANLANNGHSFSPLTQGERDNTPDHAIG